MASSASCSPTQSTRIGIIPFPVVVLNYVIKTTEGGKGLFGLMVGKVRPLECEVPGHMASAVRKHMDAGAQLIFLRGER